MAPAEPEVQVRNTGEIAAARAELHRLEPEVDDAVIVELVHAAYDEMMPVKVQSFVTVLIVHQVRGILRGRALAA